jgi:hypothetical protein
VDESQGISAVVTVTARRSVSVRRPAIDARSILNSCRLGGDARLLATRSCAAGSLNRRQPWWLIANDRYPPKRDGDGKEARPADSSRRVAGFGVSMNNQDARNEAIENARSIASPRHGRGRAQVARRSDADQQRLESFFHNDSGTHQDVHGFSGSAFVVI